VVDRLVDRGYLCRLRATDDRRQVLVKLTHDGEKFLKGLSLHHLQELQSTGPRFVRILQSLIEITDNLAQTTDKAKTKELVKRANQRKDTNHG